MTEPGAAFEVFGTDLFGEPIRAPSSTRPLFRKFHWPPFTTLDARSGPWQERKRAWLSLGIQSELGRGTNLMDDSKSSVYNGRSDWSGYRGPRLGGPEKPPVGKHDSSPTAAIRLDMGRGGQRGRVIPSEGYHPDRNFSRDYSPTASISLGLTNEGVVISGGTSIFDPVLCELAYRWFAPAGGSVLDPFAGGSVRGIVASALGLAYTGFDLSERQIVANREQAVTICQAGWPVPVWAAGDSTVEDLGGPYDFVFSCPPYGDLEVYSEDPRDLSNVPHETFLKGMGVVLERAAAVLRPDRFAAFVVGDFRGPDGTYRAFPASMIRLAAAAGLRYYNEGILLTSIGTLPVRVSYAFDRGRKLGRCHQNLLVFVKGDPAAATRVVVGAWAPVEVEEGEITPEEAEKVVAEAETATSDPVAPPETVFPAPRGADIPPTAMPREQLGLF